MKVRLPLLPDWAELWFLVSEEFSTAMLGIAEEVNSGAHTLEAAIQNAAHSSNIYCELPSLT